MRARRVGAKSAVARGGRYPARVSTVGARVLVALVSLVGVGLGLAAAWRTLTPSDRSAATGILVEGVRLEDGDDPRRVVRELGERWADEEVWLEAGPLTERLRRAEVGLAIDVETCAAAIHALGRSGALIADLATLVRARLGRVQVSLEPTLDREALRAAVEAIAARFDREPRPAEIDDAGRLVTAPEPGRAIDVEQSVAEVSDGLVRGERRFSLVTRDRPVPVDPARIARAQEPVIVGSYLTRYRMRGDEGPRAVNVRVAAEALDGAIIPAGGHLSFNERVGPRTEGRGYRVAHVIYDGEMIDGIGGGVCQVASTLHAAAFLGGLPISEHAPHSRPSAYIPMGLDATVVYPDVDLVIGNPLSVPITVRAYANGGRLSVELWARARPLEVEWRREVRARTSYEERIVEDPSLAPGQEHVSQEGGPGFVIERLRILHAGSRDITERRTLRYPPTDQVVRVSPGSLGESGALVEGGSAGTSDTVSAALPEISGEASASADGTAVTGAGESGVVD